jgi:high-affinity iron transporter
MKQEIPRYLIIFAATHFIAPVMLNASVVEDFHRLQEQLDESLLDVYAGRGVAEVTGEIANALSSIEPDVQSPEAQQLLKVDGTLTPAEQIGQLRAHLQHVAAIEMLRCQQAGEIERAKERRALITLPEFGSSVAGALLLASTDPGRSSQSGVTEALAKEYLQWQTMRVRQLLDFLQEQVGKKADTEQVIEANTTEIRFLGLFPASIVRAAGLKEKEQKEGKLVWNAGAETKEKIDATAAWRESIESSLPNLFTQADIGRMQLLLARFIKLVPREYVNGVTDGKLIIPLEYREATQFTDQSLTLVNQLAPVWKEEHPEIYQQYHQELSEKLAGLKALLVEDAAHGTLAPQSKIENQAAAITNILEQKFKITARRAGDTGDVIDETALEVRTSLGNSLAAAKADKWQEAESQRLDAYTAFDTEIEARVMPRDPELGLRTERSFLEGDPANPGIKSLLDQRVPMDQLEAGYERSLKLIDECMALLKVTVSPVTIGFTAFSIVARECLEAVVILAALLAGLRGEAHRRTRKGIAQGAWLAIGTTLLTFWLSRTLIQSLSHFGEKLEAVVSIFAVIILLIVTNWVFHRFYWVGWNAKLRSLSKSAQNVTSNRWEWIALLGVGFLTVYREGFELVLFMQSLLLEGNIPAVTIGAAAGLVGIGLLGLLTFRSGLKLPYRKLLVITGVLVVSIMVSFLGQTVRLFQTVGWMPIHPIPGLYIPSWAGLWLGIYPSWEGLFIPPLALIYVAGAWCLTRWRSLKEKRKAAPIPVAA